MKGFMRRLRMRVRNERTARRHGLRGRSACRAVVGTERCCCGEEVCSEVPRPRMCWVQISLLRFLFRGVCADHDGWGQKE